jgi:hypothetical protein
MAALGTAFECPILVWMITLNRDYSLDVRELFRSGLLPITHHRPRSITNATSL